MTSTELKGKFSQCRFVIWDTITIGIPLNVNRDVFTKSEKFPDFFLKKYFSKKNIIFYLWVLSGFPKAF